MSRPVTVDYASPAKTSRHSLWKMAVISVAMAFAFAGTFVVVMTLTLPKKDGAYGQLPFQDPLVFPVMAIGASFAALLVTLPFYFTCRSLPLWRSVTIIVSVTLAELVFVTPINAGAGLRGSFVAFAIGLVTARIFPGPSRRPSGI